MPKEIIIVIKAVSVLLSTAFLLFEYFIYFRKRYNLINGFKDEFKKGKKTERYALRVGLIEFIVGCVLSAVTVILLIVL